MFPTLPFHPLELAHTEADLEGARRPVGQVHVFDWERLTAAAVAAGTGVDQYLSSTVAAGLGRRPPGTPFVIFWVATAGAVHLTVTGPGGRQQGVWLLDAPGHRGASRGAMAKHATPWAYWNGRRLVRTHRAPGDPPGKDERYVVDVGAYPGPVVGVTDVERWEELARSPAEEPDYHALSLTEVERLSGPWGEVEILHAWLRSGA